MREHFNKFWAKKYPLARVFFCELSGLLSWGFFAAFNFFNFFCHDDFLRGG
jgi:hypothetical protein